MSSALRRVFTGAAAWVAGAVASVLVSMLALSVIGGLGGDVQPPAEMPIDNDIATTSSPPPSPFAIAPASPSPSASPSGTRSTSPPSPTPPASPTPPVPGPPRQFNTQAGVVTAECIGLQAYLVSWSPAPGYRVDDVRRGPAPLAKVAFGMFGTHRDSVVAVECSSGSPRLAHF